MATLRAYQAFDMRSVLLGNATLSVATNAFTLISGSWRTTLTGNFHLQGSGVAGTVLGFAQDNSGHPVFDATGFGRSAATVLEILETHDNDRLLAYTLSEADAITGSAANDYLIGFGGNDTLVGGGGNDQLFGGIDQDRIDGGGGADFLAGGLGIDLMRGGAGSDTYLVTDAGDRVVEAAVTGFDTILSSVSRTIAANVERLVLIGNRPIAGHGAGAADNINGNEAANWLTGGAGRDRIEGDGGADLIEGGTGADILSGGTGADTFRFASAAQAYGDRILDFVHGQDRIDLSTIDADLGHAGNQAFRFIGGQSFTGHAGDLSAAGLWLQGDLDGDRVADFVLRLNGGHAITTSDLIL